MYWVHLAHFASEAILHYIVMLYSFIYFSLYLASYMGSIMGVWLTFISVVIQPDLVIVVFSCQSVFIIIYLPTSSNLYFSHCSLFLSMEHCLLPLTRFVASG